MFDCFSVKECHVVLTDMYVVHTSSLVVIEKEKVHMVVCTYVQHSSLCLIFVSCLVDIYSTCTFGAY